MDFQKYALTYEGLKLYNKFFARNPQVSKVNINIVKKDSPPPFDRYYFVNSCAFYRPSLGRTSKEPIICIMPDKCSKIGKFARFWSYPGYVIDRTPYGVIQHELSHHIDYHLSFFSGSIGLEYKKSYKFICSAMRIKTGEEKLTNYCPNDGEWFAEICRLFITNPDLLKRLRPKSYDEIISLGIKPCEDRPWEEVLEDAPERTKEQTRIKIERSK